MKFFYILKVTNSYIDRPKIFIERHNYTRVYCPYLWVGMWKYFNIFGNRLFRYVFRRRHHSSTFIFFSNPGHSFVLDCAINPIVYAESRPNLSLIWFTFSSVKDTAK